MLRDQGPHFFQWQRIPLNSQTNTLKSPTKNFSCGSIVLALLSAVDILLHQVIGQGVVLNGSQICELSFTSDLLRVIRTPARGINVRPEKLPDAPRVHFKCALQCISSICPFLVK